MGFYQNIIGAPAGADYHSSLSERAILPCAVFLSLGCTWPFPEV